MDNTGQTTGKAPAWLTAERLGAFTDGVMAIIITILVLGIEVPEAHDFTEEGLGSFLLKIEHEVQLYMGNFFLIGTYWLLHHVLFHYVARVNRTFIALNLLFLFLLSLSPFTADVAREYRHVPMLVAIYALTYFLSGVVFFVMWRYCMRNPYLLRQPIDGAVRRSMDLRLLVAPVLTLVGIGVAMISFRFATLIFISIPFFYLRHWLVDSSWSTDK